MRELIPALVMILSTSFAASAFAEGESEYTLGAYCEMLSDYQSRYQGNVTAQQSLKADHVQYCTSLDWNGNANRMFTGHVNPYILEAPPARGSYEIASLVDNTVSQATLLEKYRAVRENASRMMSECHARAARAFESPRTERQDLLALLTGELSESGVNSACQRIPGFVSAAESANAGAARECENLQQQCQGMVESVDEFFREGRGTVSMTNEMQVARSVAHNACAVMVETALANKVDVIQERRSLNDACVSARRQLNEQNVAKNPPATGGGASATDNLWTQAAQALPQVLSLLNSEPATDLATGEPLPQGALPAISVQDEGSLPVGAVKGELAAPTKLDAGDGLPLGEGLEDLPITGRRSVTGRMAQQASGVAGTPRADGSSLSVGAKSLRGRAGGGSRWNTDVLGGNFGDAGAGRGLGRGGDGYPEAAAQGRLRGKAAVANDPTSVAAMNARLQAGLKRLGRFLPKGQRGAASVGRDGITGPHTNLFWKVSRRYQVVPTLSGEALPK